jgi:hypothetical protein
MRGSMSRVQTNRRGLLATLVLSAFLTLTAKSAESQEPSSASFVGRQVCSGCHEAEARLWQGSHHDQAMQEATRQTVLGDFNNATLTHFGVTSKFYSKDGSWCRRTGRMAPSTTTKSPTPSESTRCSNTWSPFPTGDIKSCPLPGTVDRRHPEDGTGSMSTPRKLFRRVTRSIGRE